MQFKFNFTVKTTTPLLCDLGILLVIITLKKSLFKQFLIILFSVFTFLLVKAQEPSEKTRILFIVDYSGSMQALWGEDKKFNIAKTVLFNLADSIQKNNRNIEIAVRVFGHQSHRTKNDCLDSKLEVAFAPQNANEIKEVFERIVAQGNTPIAYSLIESTKDFPEDNKTINSIILITDGLENCEGNPCDAVVELKKKRVTINPYIIGLDIESDLIQDFECIGTFVNAKDESTFTKILETAVKKVTNKTSVEINLLSKEKKLISNTPITFYNHYTGKVVYNFIHSLDKKGKADTISLDPRGVFDVVVHTFPPLKIEGIELKAGIHNVINTSVLKGRLDFNYEKAYDDKKIDYVLRFINEDKIIYNYTVEDKYFIADKYNLTVTTTPFKTEKVKNIPIERGVHQFIKDNGKLTIDMNHSILASLYVQHKQNWNLIKDFGELATKEEIKLQPGKYKLVFIEKDTKQSQKTKTRNFEILEKKTVLINK
ncbi:MAG: Ca-activated chloride channel family protein [Planctomycetota bacterium]